MKHTRLILVAILALAVAAVAAAHSEHKHPVTGTVKMLHENHLAINTSENKHLTVHLTDKTVLTKGTRADLKAGTRVTVVLQDDGKTATSVEIAAAAEAQKQAAPQADKAVRVEPNKVCMINDRSMAMEQIPVAIEGKTYYGCCPMCKERLEKDEASRYAVDPVSGKKVDKAKAVIGALPGAAVLYFENAENLAKYNAAAK